LERLVANQLVSYISLHQILVPNQSGSRAGHSTESAITKVLSDLLDAVDHGDSAVIALVNLSAAFDTVDHAILLDRARITFVVRDAALDWFRSYTYAIGFSLFVVAIQLPVLPTLSAVYLAQGSVLGPILFIVYTVDLQDIVAAHGLLCHLYAEYSQSKPDLWLMPPCLLPFLAVLLPSRTGWAPTISS
jgi:Reverse transcriptase (RNA-dependent DNA polymerase)